MKIETLINRLQVALGPRFGAWNRRSPIHTTTLYRLTAEFDCLTVVWWLYLILYEVPGRPWRSVDTILDLVVGNQLEIMTETRWKQPNDFGRDYQSWLNGCHCQIQNIGEFPGDLRTPPNMRKHRSDGVNDGASPPRHPPL